MNAIPILPNVNENENSYSLTCSGDIIAFIIIAIITTVVATISKRKTSLPRVVIAAVVGKLL
jgi:hypothetical protein